MAGERTVIRGIVLRSTDTKESDKILTVLTAAGKLTVIAKGARGRKSRVTACTQLLAYSELTISESRGWQYLSEGATIALFEGVRRDIVLLSLASYFAELTEAVVNGLTARQLARVMRPHPTFEEAVSAAVEDLLEKLEK